VKSWFFDRHEGETMADNKADTKPQTPTPISLASRLMGSKLRLTLAESRLDEPWRTKNSRRKSKRRK
jgi:hypothetical protein